MPRDSTKQETEAHVPRPANCFMIFRADWLRNSIANSVQGNSGPQRQKDVSQDAAAAWRNLSPALKHLYKIQADLVKKEHKKQHPKWVYRPRRKTKAVDHVCQEGSSPKRVDGDQMVAPQEKPFADVKEGRKVEATPATAPKEVVWKRSWFSGSPSMTDPFYSAPLQSLASESSSAPPPILSVNPHPFPPPAQMHGFGMTPNFHATPPMYHHGGELRNLERRGYDALGLKNLRTSSQATTQTEPPVVSGASTPTNGSPIDEVSTPGSEVQPPTQSLMGISDLTYNRFLESYCNHDSWGPNPIYNLDFDPSSPTEL